ncbi:hypothetical protein YC2023_005225 [Brassica napus]
MDGSIRGFDDPFLLLFSNPYHGIFEVVLLAFHFMRHGEVRRNITRKPVSIIFFFANLKYHFN